VIVTVDIADAQMGDAARFAAEHLRYMQLETQRHGRPTPLLQRLRSQQSRDRTRAKPPIRMVIKDVAFPSILAKPVALFRYMYFIRLGLLDGRAGLRFCFYQAWYKASVAALQPDARQATGGVTLWIRV
jgi:hypothetical protein